MADQLTTCTGQCQCGKLRLTFETALPNEQLIPRACDCDFCRQRGAAYVSDPLGRLVIEADAQASLQTVRQGSETADFIQCRHCGDVVAVVFDDGSTRYGTLNANCLAVRTLLPAAQSASPKLLSVEEKMQRWKKLWVSGVKINIATNSGAQVKTLDKRTG